MTEKNPKPVCEKCGKEGPTNLYKPDPTGKPDVTERWCDDCVLGGSEETEGKEKMAKKPKAKQNKAEDVETKPIDRVDIEKKIEGQEKDIDTLVGKRKGITQQLTQMNDMIMAKRGAVAGLRDLLCDDS